MHDNSLPALSPKILGQLLLMQSIMCSLPEEKSIFSFVCRGLADVPGVDAVRYSETILENRDTSTVSFPLRVSDSVNGELLIRVSDFRAFSPYVSHLNNFCFMLAVILEERQQRSITEEFKSRLEQLVQERTASLQENEEKFRSIFEASTDAIILADEKGIISEANNAAGILFGYQPAEMKHAKLTHFMPERYRNNHLQGVARVISTGRTTYLNRPLEFDGLHKDGSEFPVELNVATWFAGGKRYFSGIIRDISSRRNAEKALKDSEEKLNIIFNSTSDGMLVADVDTRMFLAGNRTICEMLGYSAEEITGLGVDDIHPTEKLPEVHRQFARQVEKEIDVYHEAPVKRKDGTVFFADISAAPAMIGERRYLIGLFRDVSELKKMEENARQSQKLEAIGTLAGGIAHDFNNILSAILGFTELALHKQTPESEIFQDLQQVLRAGMRAKELVKQILTFSRKSKAEILPLQIQFIVKEVMKLLRSTLPSTIEIRQDIEEGCSPINADATQIHQVLMNLCTNAYHAMEESGGTLSIILKEVALDAKEASKIPGLTPGRYAKLVVQDTGSGIKEDAINHIFEPYFTTKPQGKGSGLGLAVVHGIVESHGGKITCVSKPGSGAIFSVFFPVIETAEKTGDEFRLPLPAATGNERILFVDDEESIVLLGKMMLESLGYKVFPMTDSSEALEAFRAAPDNYDLVITDQTMPHLPGSELAKALIKIRPDIPIILCSGYSSMVDDGVAKSIGIKAFILKPVSRNELAEAIRKALQKPSRA